MLKDTFSFLLERHQNKMLPTLLADIPDEKLSSQPVAGMNHPAWILGHLLAVEQKFTGGILRRPFQTSLDANWWEIYGIGSVPKSDRSLYKSKEFYITGLAETSNQLLTFIREKSDTDLEAPNTDPDFGKFFPNIAATLGAAATHRAYHSGQIAAWRKTMGLPHVGM